MKAALKSIVFMFVITLCFAAMVSAVRYVNNDRIERNQHLKLQAVVLKVLALSPPAGSSAAELVEIFDRQVKTIDVDNKTLYVGYESDGKTIKGYAFPVGGPGFWGPIYGMVAVTPDASKIIGLAFYKHGETPGLGGRITEAWFTDQFKGLPLFPIEGDKEIFYLKPTGSGQAKNDLDAITGASNTSAAVQRFLNKDLNDFLTRTWKDLKKG